MSQILLFHIYLIILEKKSMSSALLKDKINKSLEELNASNLQSAYLILKELINQQNYVDVKVNKKLIDTKITEGIYQLDNGEGTDFRSFLNEMQETYGKKK
jgi:hypothetical protein